MDGETLRARIDEIPNSRLEKPISPHALLALVQELMP
jgi:hypothetical protein